MNALVIKERGMLFSIGKINRISDRCIVNVITDFNPMKKLPMIDMIGSLPTVIEVTNVSSWGGFAVELNPDSTEVDFQESLLTLLATVLV